MPKVVLSGYFGFGNAGDEAILAAEVAALRQLIPQVEIAVLSGNPHETAATYTWKPSPEVIWAVSRALRSADLISGGRTCCRYYQQPFDPLLSGCGGTSQTVR